MSGRRERPGVKLFERLVFFGSFFWQWKKWTMLKNKNMKQINYLLLWLIILILSCNNDDSEPPEPIGPQLPSITTEGLTTFGCLKDGEVWLPDGYHNLFEHNPEATYDEANDFLDILITQSNVNNNGSPEIINITSIIEKVGTYSFFQNVNLTNPIYRDSLTNPGETYKYFKDSTYNNRIEILKLDSINDIISGTFEVRLVNEDLPDTILFSDGRFDSEYTY